MDSTEFFVLLACLMTAASSQTPNCSITCSAAPDNTSETCNTTTGECLFGCMDHYVGPICSFQCPVACALPNGNTSDICNTTTGECLFGCEDRYMGPDCSFQCPVTCAQPDDNNSDTCNYPAGECLFGCKDRYVGPDCSLQCPVTCALPNNNSSVICEYPAGNCTSGCVLGYQGSNCSESICPESCLSDQKNETLSCDNETSTCFYGCKRGFAGETCNISCPEHCGNTNLNGTEICDPETLECRSGCGAGFAGPHCNFECPSNCILSPSVDKDTCNLTTGSCFYGCKYPYAGPNCASECPSGCVRSNDTLIDACFTISGECLFGCEQGYAGANCTIDCPVNCGVAPKFYAETCNSTSHTCLYGCLQGFAGESCSTACPKNCRLPPDNNTQTCDIVNGSCFHGCMSGYGGDDCSYECPENCMAPNNSSRTCDNTNGFCSFGCKSGFAGNDCNFTCPEHCGAPKVQYNTETCSVNTTDCLHGCELGFAGNNCSVECPANCLPPAIGEDAEVCDASSEVCVFGCIAGYFGHQCLQKCNDKNRLCEECTLGATDSSISCTKCILNHYVVNGGCSPCSYWCAETGTDIPTCEPVGGLCTGGCKSGKYGRFCDKDCSVTCKGGNCKQLTGECSNGCDPQSYCGQTCKISCAEGCLGRSCDILCNCKNGCYAGKWGLKCDSECPENCNPDNNTRTCDSTDGSCLYGCSNNEYWGNDCKKPCSVNCKNSKCDNTGHCLDGCVSNKVFGQNCSLPCPSHCQNGTCQRDDGYCEEGCLPGWFGHKCDNQCSENCIDDICNRTNAYCECDTGWYGLTCRVECGKACLSSTCEKVSGNCSYGCIGGYEGAKCEKLIPINSNILGTYWIYIIIGGPVALITAVSIISVLVTRKMSIKRRQEESLLSEDEMFDRRRDRDEKKQRSPLNRVSQLFVVNPMSRLPTNTKLHVSNVLEKVVRMEFGDFASEFERLPAGLTKSHEVARCIDNSTLNLYNGIYPYDDNRVVLKRAPDIEVRREGTRNKLRKFVKSVTFGADFGTFGKGKEEGDYMVMGKVPAEKRSKSPIKSILKRHTGAYDIENPDKEPGPSGDENDGYADVSLDDDKVDLVKDTEKSEETSKNKDKPYDYVGFDQMTKELDDALAQMTQVNETPYDKAGVLRPEEKPENPFDLYDHTKDMMQEGTSKEFYDNKQTEPKLTDEYAVVQKTQRSDPDSTVSLDTAGTSAAFSKTGNMYDYTNTNLKPPGNEDDKKKNDYINASFIKIHKDNRKFIAAQAPSKITVSDFWLMIWEQRVDMIVMLVDIPEDGFSRCEKYWPEKGDSLTFDDLTVTTSTDEGLVDYSVRKFTLSLHGVDKEVVHLQFKSWPEDGCPSSAIEFIQFHQKYRSMIKTIGQSAPVVVHCTAGVGRTGVFIALDTIFEEGRDRGLIDVFSCVERLREQRPDMVHHLEQYAFLYKTIAQTFALECIPYKKDKISDKVNDLKKFDDTGKSRLQRIFERMKTSLQLDDQQIPAMDQVQERRGKDRPTSDIPDVVFRASLPKDEYINAVVIDTLRDKEGIVVTQMPVPDTLTDFCQLLMHYQIGTIVMLNNVDAGDKSMGFYWPKEKETNVMMGTFKVTVTDTLKQNDFVTRKMKLESVLAEDDEPPRNITMIQLKAWKAVKNLPNVKSLVKLLIMARQYVNETKERKLLVHCLNGSDQSGLFCALYNILETLDLEDEVSITSIVRKVLARRPSAFPEQNQLEVCFTTAIEYLTQKL